MKPNFFIVGAPKCGTTSMWAYLRQHPDIFMPKLKEPQYFSTDIILRFKKDRVTDIETYLKLFSKARNEKMIGEASPTYLRSQVAAENIMSFNPKSKIIIMIRNPVDAICSAFHMHVVNGLEKITDLEDALNAEKQQLNNHIFYQNRVRYSSRISQYIDVFGRKNLFIIIFDDFKVNTKYVYREALKFLEVNSNICPNFRIYNPARSGRNYKIIRYFSKYPRTQD